MIETSLLSLADYEAWGNCLPASVSVYGSREYATVASTQTGSRPHLFVTQGVSGSVVYPHFVRPVSDVPGCPPGAAGAVDTVTPEFTGPMLIGHPEPEVIQEFRRGFADYARENRIVSEFAHLHPWKSAPQCLDGERVSFDREIVYVDLEKPMEEIWTHSLGVHCRKHIRKAMRLGATWRVATQKGEIEHFYEIYIGTMKRREAAERYYLPLTYFTSLFELLPHNVAYFLVEYGDRVVTAGLCLYDDTDVYGYLGGMDREFEEVRPFNLMNYAIIQWGHETGRKRYLLGGGYRPGDGIFKFKASFSPLTEKFYLYRKVHDERLYGELVHGRFNGSTALIEQEVTYFPKYRAE